MNIYYLKSPSKEEMLSALEKCGFEITSEGGSLHAVPNAGGAVVDIIGDVYEKTGVLSTPSGDYDEYGDMLYIDLPAYEKLPGFHCNFYARGSLPEELQKYWILPAPATPYRKLAGT